MEKEVYLIIGLGNIGEEYAHTRHNAGFDTLALLTERLGVRLRNRPLLRGMTAEATDGERKIVLCAPTTYMNASGECAERVMHHFGCAPERMLVIYDDIDLPPGRVRARKSGGPGTHNGMRSIVEALGTQAFPRIRIGTGDRPAGQDLAAWVLGRCGAEERKTLEAAFELAADCALEWTRNGMDACMRMAAGAGKPAEPGTEMAPEQRTAKMIHQTTEKEQGE